MGRVDIMTGESGGPISAHLERYYGVVHAGIVPDGYLAVLAASGFERGGTSFVPLHDDSYIVASYDRMRAHGRAPDGLSTQDAFVRRFRQLVGESMPQPRRSEVAEAIDVKGPDTGTPLGKQRAFERTVAGRLIQVLESTGMLETRGRDSSIVLPRVRIVRDPDPKYPGRLRLSTDGNIRARSGRHTNGRVLQFAPRIGSVQQRIKECQQGIITGADIISPSYFGREVCRLLVERAGVAEQLTYNGEGLTVGAQELRRRAAFDAERYAPGFAAFIIDAANRLPTDNVEAIAIAHELLAVNGVAIMAGGLVSQGSSPRFSNAVDVLRSLRGAFGPPARQGVVELSDDLVQVRGVEALFIKR